MTIPPAPHLRKRGVVHDPVGSDSAKARLFLMVACFWPLLLIFLFSSHAPPPETPANGEVAAKKNPALRLRKFLDRVDIVGYGPTHPRVAVVVVGDDAQKVLRSVESVFRNTDLNRLFLVCVVMDGIVSDPALVRSLREIEQGAVPHWHGLQKDEHTPGDQFQEEDEEKAHGKKIHVIFSESTKKLGVALSRSDAVDFLALLAKKHESNGLKSPEEDLILLLLKSGSELASRKWLSPVTSALIVPPPLMDDVSLKLANAVSFAPEGYAIGFDKTFRSYLASPHAEDMALSSGNSYPTPLVSSFATALRLDTYRQLPSQDTSLMGQYEADLDLSLNLWLCADGIDVLPDVMTQGFVSEQLTTEQAARFAAAWMDHEHADDTFAAVAKTHPDLTKLEWETMMEHAKNSPDFSPKLQSRCRPFKWYAEEINVPLEPTDTTNNAPKKEKLPDKPLPLPDIEGGDETSRKPSVPLDQARLDIIQKATPIELAYVDVSDGHKEHPHRGARDEKGNWGYIHDETVFHKNPPAFDFPDLEGACKKRDAHYTMLTEKVYVDLDADKKANGKKRAKIMCLIYSSEPGHERIPTVLQTWGQKCDGFMVGSNKTDPSVGAVDLPHEGIEEYDNIYQKVRSMWSYVYDNYYDKYDWFHIGGDDLYLIMENLRLYLESEEILTAQNGGVYLPNGDETKQVPMFLGRRFAYMGDMDDIFNSGGSGYTLNKAAVKTLVVNGFPKYMPHAKTFSEDTMVARVLRKLGVFPYETKDETGAERYMPFMPGHHLNYRLPKDPSKDWYAKYSINIKFGLDHCAAKAVAFHYAKGDAMKRMHAILYKKCP